MPAKSVRKQQILQWFEANPYTVVTPLALSLLLNIPYDTVKHVVRDLYTEGKLIQVGRGLYAHPSFKYHLSKIKERK